MTSKKKFIRPGAKLNKSLGPINLKFEPLSQAQMDFKPSAKSWSTGEVAHHLVLGEKMIQGILKELLTEAQENRATTRRVPFSEFAVAPQVLPKALFQIGRASCRER